MFHHYCSLSVLVQSTEVKKTWKWEQKCIKPKLVLNWSYICILCSPKKPHSYPLSISGDFTFKKVIQSAKIQFQILVINWKFFLKIHYSGFFTHIHVWFFAYSSQNIQDSLWVQKNIYLSYFIREKRDIWWQWVSKLRKHSMIRNYTYVSKPLLISNEPNQ